MFIHYIKSISSIYTEETNVSSVFKAQYEIENGLNCRMGKTPIRN